MKSINQQKDSNLLLQRSPENPVGQEQTYLDPVGGLDSSQVPPFIHGFGLQGVFVPGMLENRCIKGKNRFAKF